MPLLWGSCPVSMAARLGEQVGQAQCALRNTAHACAARSMFGVGMA